MKDSVKANLIVFLIIGLIALGISTAFASLTINDENDSYKIISIKNDSFEPNYINKVPTIIPKVENNTTNTTSNSTYVTNYTQTYHYYNRTYDYLEYW